MSRNRRTARKNIKESDIRKIEWFCSISAAILIVLCFIFVSGILQNLWVLNFIHAMGILMNLSAILLGVVRKNKLAGVLGLLLILAEAASLVYFIVF